jgi:hypothetical protein|tara:strand:+ start:128 stop:361 length:234 start_codon:yes stop_codon:yes gene_type:complete
MAINDNITVMAGKKTPIAVDVDTKSTIKHATTGKVYASESEAEIDVNNPATTTTNEDIKRDVAITVNKLPDIFGGSS